LIRDPSHDERGIIVFAPKGATDSEPGNRIFCVARKSASPAIFAKLVGHVSTMLPGPDLNSIVI
jgi:hypothetical protein